MKKTFYNVKIAGIFIFTLAHYYAQGQNAGIYGIFQGSATYFSKVDSATGNMVNLNPLVLTVGASGTMSTLTDAVGGHFYFSNAKQIITFDISNGAFIDSSVIFPLTTNEYFIGIRYNVCDSGLYGIFNKLSPSVAYLARLDPLSGQLTPVSMQSVIGFGSSGAAIDPYQGIYYFLNGSNLSGVSLATGSTVSSVTTVPPPGESFGHLAYNCANSLLYGLSANPTTLEKYLATVDPLTGVVTHVSNINNLNNFFVKLAFSDPTIDPAAGSFYYIAGSKTLVGVDVISGSATNVQTLQFTNNQSFQLPTFYPQCYCDGSTGVEEYPDHIPSPLLFPNPAGSTVTVKLKKPETIIITNLTGVKLFEKVIPKTQFQENYPLDVSFLAPGVYFLKAGDKTGKLVKY